MSQRKRAKKNFISLPTNFEHRVHTVVDSREGKLVGLPRQWAGLVRVELEEEGRKNERKEVEGIGRLS